MFEEIEALELQLLLNDMRKDQTFLDGVLSDDFLEYGQSGNVYTKQDIITRLQVESVHRRLEAGQTHECSKNTI